MKCIKNVGVKRSEGEGSMCDMFLLQLCYVAVDILATGATDSFLILKNWEKFWYFFKNNDFWPD